MLNSLGSTGGIGPKMNNPYQQQFFDYNNVPEVRQKS